MPQTVDTSIYQNIQPLANPLNQLQGIVGLQQGLQQNKLTQQELDMRQGMTQAAQQSVDPTTGQINNNKFLAIVGQDPRTARNFGTVNAQTQANVTATNQAQQEQLKNGLAHLQAANALTSGLLADPDLGRVGKSKDIINGLISLVGNDDSAVTAQSAAQQIANMPPDSNPQAQKQWVMQHAAQNAALQSHIESMLPKPVAVQTGAGTLYVDANPITNPAIRNQNIPNQLGPDQLSQMVSWIGDDKTQKTGTRAMAIAQMGGLSNALNPNGPSPAGTPATNPSAAPQAPGGPAPSPLGTGRIAPPPVAAPAPATATPLTTAQSPAAVAAQSQTGAKSGEALANAQQTATGFPQRMFQLQQALTGLQGAGTTGPGTETRQNIVSYVNAIPYVGDLARGGGLDPSKIASYDEANKYLTQYAMSQAGQLGQGTNEKLATALTGNASTHISNLAAQDVVRANMALEKMRQAGTLAFQESRQPEQNYNKFISQWSSAIDPRAFAIDTMTQSELAKMLKGMSKTEYNNLKQSHQQAVQLGLAQDPQTVQNGGQ